MDYDELFAYLFFRFGFVQVELFNCNPVPRGTRNHVNEALYTSRLALADSGLQMILEIALGGVSAKIQPLRLV